MLTAHHVNAISQFADRMRAMQAAGRAQEVRSAISAFLDRQTPEPAVVR